MGSVDNTVAAAGIPNREEDWDLSTGRGLWALGFGRRGAGIHFGVWTAVKFQKWVEVRTIWLEKDSLKLQIFICGAYDRQDGSYLFSGPLALLDGERGEL